MKVQIVRTSPSKIFKEQYLTKKGLKLKAEGATPSMLAKYTKNRYFTNRSSRPLKKITHILNQ